MPDHKTYQPFIRERGAGVLLHITSLPSNFGIGDLGPEAKKFTDFLGNSRQKYWQLLPLNPTSADTGHSPYSSVSAMAGNILLISPEELFADGLLDKKDLRENNFKLTTRVNFEETEQSKEKLFRKAFSNFVSKNSTSRYKQFQKFNQREGYWLNDYVLFVVIKNAHQQKPWYEWPTSFKSRNEKALKQFSLEHSDEIEYQQWLQFIFHEQWSRLREYCHQKNIQLIGDLPIYVSHDSVDVWSNQKIFQLDSACMMTAVAGVPPDYFNKNGQRWGMPLYRWDVLKKTGYAWWITRLKKNIDMIDILRLDHFRAFADYWSVPSIERTAKNGQWKRGPREDFFRTLSGHFKTLPFIAEDLGKIDEPVLALRDEFVLAGMLVLQFAFGDNMADSEYIPHRHTINSIVYTGTHDNNTSVGWLRKELKTSDINRIESYVQQTVNEKNIHDIMIRMAYGSVSNTVIVPMQDLIGLDENNRMNTPASTKDNWQWRLAKDQISKALAVKIKNWVLTYGRS